MKILLPDTIDLDPALPEGWESATIDARAEIPEEHWDAAAMVVWGSSRKNLASAAQNLPDLRLVQSLMAGVDHIMKAGFGDGVQIASGSGLHSATVTEHTLALLLSLVRRLPEARLAQEQHEWSRELGGIQELHPEGRITTLLDARVLIWGFGEIGQHLAPVLKALGAEVTGAARSAGERAGFPVIAEEDVLGALPETDVLICVLPATDATERAIGAEVFEALPDHAIVVNVGRGTTLDQDTLLAALEDGRIGSAAIDVTDPEPLPSDSPLWDAPRLLITPHGAGGRPVGASERIAENLRRLDAGEELLHEAG